MCKNKQQTSSPHKEDATTAEKIIIFVETALIATLSYFIMTIEVGYRVVFKKDSTKIGCVKEIKHVNKTKLFSIAWDDLDFCCDPEKFFKAQEIMEHYKLKTLSGLERCALITERNLIVENKLLQLSKRKLSQPHSQPHPQPQCLSFSSNVAVNESTATKNPNELAFKLNLIAAPALFSENNINSEERSFAVEKYPVIEPSYQVNKFCCFRNRVYVEASLGWYYSDDRRNIDCEDDDEIFDAKFPYITKEMMRYYVSIYTYKELFKNNLIERINQTEKEEYNNNHDEKSDITSSSTCGQETHKNKKLTNTSKNKKSDFDVITELLKLSLVVSANNSSDDE